MDDLNCNAVDNNNVDHDTRNNKHDNVKGINGYDQRT